MDRKQEILKAAEKMFLKYGLRKCTMHDIAKECGMRKSALYYYFDNRDEIFLTMIHNRFEEMSVEMNKAIESAQKTKGKIKAFMHKKWQIINDYKPFMDLFEKKTLSIADIVKEQDKMLKFDSDCVERIVSNGIKKDEIEVESVEPLVTMILGVTYGSIYAIIKMGAGWDYDEKMNEAIKIIYKGIGN